jgi:hypothetical protein
MIKRVRKSERPIITGLGGICCPPIACLRKPSTTTIRVNDVNMTSIAGSSDRKLTIRKTDITGLFMSIAFVITEPLSSSGVSALCQQYS